MTILVTGAAGFIGSNFVLDWLAQSDEQVINLDNLTYAGNLENLASLDGDARHLFVKGDIGDFELVTKLLAEHHPALSLTLPPNRMLTAAFTARKTSSRPISSVPSACLRPYVPTTVNCAPKEVPLGEKNGQKRIPFPACLHRRSLRLARH
jgi:NAD(P)-dependent dehydrogenase (short-subunit alcohol dehydrogenase family)